MSSVEEKQKEVFSMRLCRGRGLLPNPAHLTGARRDLAEELQRLVNRIDEIDAIIFSDDSCPLAGER
jgi:hypothetical protein